ncbi:alpha/beta hydrolase [Parvularcula sp. LCG005]|uniref:alpha/beta hydrolase n=1 Tax=Parvularcula sp. LCG005 TaxID=3078805 RepID=UPI0029433489|nr:alpha/beta hydrolase [Parvularcula sp. LCG005]WOI53636.1 alpha/beta hydrolase [Parvularcula sp. LCG005]
MEIRTKIGRGDALWALVVVMLVVIVVVARPKPYTPSTVTAADEQKATDYLDANLAPLPDDWTFETLDFADEGVIRFGSAGPVDAPVTILYIPGFTSTVELYADFYAHWRAQGYRVVAMDLPGQGGSVRRRDNPEKPYTGRFQQYGNAVDLVTDHIAAQSDSQIILVGESMGGHAVLRAAADHEMDIAGIVPLVPALEANPGMPRAAAKAYAWFANHTRLGNRYAPGQRNWHVNWDSEEKSQWCGDREDRIHLRDAFYTLHTEYRVGGVTAKWFSGLERSGRDLTDGAALDDLSVPVRMILAGQDNVVFNDRSLRLCSDGLADCEVVTIEAASHCLGFEDDAVRLPVLASIDELAVSVITP